MIGGHSFHEAATTTERQDTHPSQLMARLSLAVVITDYTIYSRKSDIEKLTTFT